MALKMLQQAIDQCPESLWLSGEGHSVAYWKLAFHTLFFFFQHHAAQLGDRLRSATGKGLDWR
jgi:hypothetical protein